MAKQQASQQAPVAQNVCGNDASDIRARTVSAPRKEPARPSTNASTYQAARHLDNNHEPKQKANFFTRNSLIAVAVVTMLAVVGVFAFQLDEQQER